MSKRIGFFLTVSLTALGLVGASAAIAQSHPGEPVSAQSTTPAAPTANNPGMAAPPAPPLPPPAPAAPEEPVAMKPGGQESGGGASAPAAPARPRRHHDGRNEAPMGDHKVPADRTVSGLVSIFGNSTLDGQSEEDVVSVFGNTTVNGVAHGDAVAVFGSNIINGEVDGDAVAVFGSLHLGPKAVVRGDAVSVGGHLDRAPGAVVMGDVQEVVFLPRGWPHGSFQSWVRECARWGRPLAFSHDVAWAWALAGLFLAFYLLLALLFPRALNKCAETLEQRPGGSLLTVVLTVLITPLLLLLLAVTGVGLLLVPFLLLALLIGTLFGKAVMCAWLGRRVTRWSGSKLLRSAVIATLIGGVLLMLLYTVPFLGFLLWKALDVIGLGVVVYALIISLRREKPPVAPAAPAAAAASVATTAAATPPAAPNVEPPMLSGLSSAGTGGGAPLPLAASPLAPLPAPTPTAALARAGFWIRLVASFLDAVIVGVAAGAAHAGSWFPLLFLIYCVALWALKGSTIGGIVFGLKVVRLDERKVDWSVALVRGLGGFLSLAIAGLGFVWVAFDRERQSWHDKIAGTVIVRAPKGVSLI